MFGHLDTFTEVILAYYSSDRLSEVFLLAFYCLLPRINECQIYQNISVVYIRGAF